MTEPKAGNDSNLRADKKGKKGGDPAPEGNMHEAVDLTSTTESKSPTMPHENDERVGMTGGEPSRKVQQGAQDVKRGLQDTSRATEADQAYKKQK